MMKKIPFFMAVSLFLCSCGLLGPLYLPDIQSFIDTDIKDHQDSIKFSIRTDEINTTYNPQGIILSYYAADDAEHTSFDLANNHVLFSGNRELNIQQDLKEPVTYITLQFAINKPLETSQNNDMGRVYAKLSANTICVNSNYTNIITSITKLPVILFVFANYSCWY